MRAENFQGLLTSELFRRVLVEPFERGANELQIVSGYGSPAMLTRHREELFRRFKRLPAIELVCGMTGIEGILEASHLGFLSLQSRYPLELSVSYLRPPRSNHSKIYVWSRDGKPVEAFLGSANYSQFGFGTVARSASHSESMLAMDPDLAAAYWLEVSPHVITCDDPDAERVVGIKKRAAEARVFETDDPAEPRWGEPAVRIPLFIERENRIHDKSGLNWGQREGRDPNQAYIPVPRSLQRSEAQEGFFPERGRHFQVVTSDGRGMVLVVAQDNGKALQTPEDNAQLGEYFRERLGVASGAPVNLSDLDRFGSRYVTFYRVDDETYLMHFEPDDG
ncbi:restriction endonuclease PLD domain-containing protein [Agrococcus sp. TSP3-2-1]|uniref:restriction endonuclease PLD domain-containing protein n=1 Tax=Agrococcus sp. TSP3-2-1 TaxID=2804583 RepID=UPI003CF6534A